MKPTQAELDQRAKGNTDHDCANADSTAENEANHQGNTVTDPSGGDNRQAAFDHPEHHRFDRPDSEFCRDHQRDRRAEQQRCHDQKYDPKADIGWRVYQAQTNDPGLDAKAEECARRLGLAYERRFTGYGDLAVEMGAMATA